MQTEHVSGRRNICSLLIPISITPLTDPLPLIRFSACSAPIFAPLSDAGRWDKRINVQDCNPVIPQFKSQNPEIELPPISGLQD